MNLKLSIAILLASLCVKVSGQDIPKFGKIPNATIEMEVYQKDSSAEAVILFDVGNIEFLYNKNTGWQTVFKRRTAIKVFTKAGYDWADQEVSTFHSNDGDEVLTGLKGMTYNLESGKVVKSKLDKSAKYSEKTSKYWNTDKFTMPDVKEGSVIEFSYQITSEFYFNLRSWEFQHAIPIIYSEYTTQIPEYYNYRKLTQGYYQFSSNEETEENRNFQITNISREGNIVSKSTATTSTINYQLKKQKLVAENLPAMKTEVYVTSVSNYIMKIDYELQSTNFPSGSKDYRNSWESLNKQFAENQFFGGLISRDGFIKDDLVGIIDASEEALVRSSQVYELVRSKMNWNGINSTYANTNLRQAYNANSGNSADINLILTAALKSCGVNAYPVLISTRNNGLIRENFPISKQFNYVISAIEIDGKIALLDATEKDIPFGYLPTKCLNGKGWAVVESGGKWIDLLPKKGYRSTTEMDLIFAGEDLEGKLKISKESYASFSDRQKILSDGEEKYVEDFSSNNEEWEITSFSFENADNPYEPFVESYDLKVSNAIEEAGDLYFFNPLLIGQMKENPFKIEKRDYPVDFTCPRYSASVIKYTLPDGYVVEESPATKTLSLPNKKGRFIYSVTVSDNTISVTSVVDIKKHLFVPEEYLYLKEFFSQVVEKHAEQIVIKKKT